MLSLTGMLRSSSASSTAVKKTESACRAPGCWGPAEEAASAAAEATAADMAATAAEVAAVAEVVAGAAEDGGKGDLVETDAVTGRDLEGTDGVTGRDLEAVAGVNTGCFNPGIAPAEKTLHSWQCPVYRKDQAKAALFLISKTQRTGAGCKTLRV